jgi:hypothetical protein
MKRLLLLALLCQASLAGRGVGQCCRGGNCGPLRPSVPALPAGTVWEWRCYPGSETFGLFRGGVQVGAWTPAHGYQALGPGDTWSEPGEAPVELPGLIKTLTRCKCNRDCPCGFGCDCYRRGKCSPGCNCAPRKEAEKDEPEKSEPKEGARIDTDGTLNFGLDRQYFEAPRQERYAINGLAVSREDVLKRLMASVPDDQSKPFLTVIGAVPARRQVLADLEAAPALAPWKGKLRVQAYAPDEWAVARAGFATGGSPTLYYQAPDGTVLHRQDDYAGGADALATALRRADPSYNPAGDPDRRKALPGLGRDLPWSVPLILLGAAALLTLYRPKKEVTP